MSRKEHNPDPLWLRSWRRRDKTFHIEVRSKRPLEVVETYQGADHTLHIIVRKSEARSYVRKA